jgi:hypothetical protein
MYSNKLVLTFLRFVLTVDTIRGTEFIFNDEYIFATVNDGETDQVVIRKRNVDESTGLWIVPRPLRSQMIDSENAVGSDGEPINVVSSSLPAESHLLGRYGHVGPQRAFGGKKQR